MPERCFKEKHICPSIKNSTVPGPRKATAVSSSLRNVRKSPQQLIHAVPQVVKTSAQIVHVGSVNTRSHWHVWRTGFKLLEQIRRSRIIS